jgi:hypothetical protein
MTRLLKNVPAATVGVIRRRKQFGFSVAKIAAETGCSVRQVRTVLTKPARSRREIQADDASEKKRAERKKRRAMERASVQLLAIRDNLLRAGCSQAEIDHVGDQAFGLLRPRRPIPIQRQQRVPRS